MERHHKTWFVVVILGLAVLLGTGSAAEAQFRLRVEDVGLGVGIVITDEMLGDFAAGVPGLIVTAGSVGSFSFTLTVGTSKPIISGLDLSFTAATVTAGTIRVTLEDTGYTNFADGEQLFIRSTVSGTLTDNLNNGSVVLNSWVSPNDLAPDLGPDTFPPGGLGPIGAVPVGSIEAWPGGLMAAGSGVFGGISDALWVKSGPYALFAQATITFGLFGGTIELSEHQTVEFIPAPGGLVLALAALPVFGLAWLRRRKKTG